MNRITCFVVTILLLSLEAYCFRFERAPNLRILTSPCTLTCRQIQMATTSFPPRWNRKTKISAATESASEVSKPKTGLLSKSTLKTAKKLLPLGAFLHAFQDVLIVTAPNGGAEIIPFLKTYVNLPSAILFTLLYSSMCNRMSQANVFYSILGPFLAFFGSFAAFIYPNRHILHPVASANWLATVLPSFMLPLVSIFRNWTYAVFYVMAELWGSVVISLLFWGFSNEVATVQEAKKYYPLFGLMANVALIFSGQYVNFVSSLRAGLAPGVDQWGYSLKLLMAAVVGCGSAVVGLYALMQNWVLKDPECVKGTSATSTAITDTDTSVILPKKKKEKSKMSPAESWKFLSSSPYIRDLATLVICYGMSINIVEVTWKSKLQAAFPDPNAYSAFMGNFASATGVATLLLMLFGRFVLSTFGWTVAALVTPVTLLSTGAMFFSLSLFPAFFKPITLRLGTTPLMLAVLVGAAQNVLSKGAKYALFDPCKEVAYIPLDSESKTKGKAAIDVIGNPLGKSGGSLLQQLLIAATGSLAASTPYLGGLLGVIIVMWIKAAKSLGIQFAAKSAEMGEEGE
eukprot:gene2001-3892_t